MRKIFLNTIGSHSGCCLITKKIKLSYLDLDIKIKQIAKYLEVNSVNGMFLENSFEWMLIDLAAIKLNITLVPIPTFFSDEQIRSIIESSHISVVITNNIEKFKKLFDSIQVIELEDFNLYSVRLNTRKRILDGISKITFTSGSTGKPKGVCLNLISMLKVASSLNELVELNKNDVHTCLLPLSTLLENIGGIYAPLLAGAKIYIPSPEESGLTGSSNLDIEKMFSCLEQSKATTTIMTPQLLKQLIILMEKTKKTLPTLRFLAVGGAVVSTDLLFRAEAMGLPVYEGYGLSECASVVALNTHKKRKIGSVGQLLPHVNIKFNEANELFIKGSTFSRYLGTQTSPDKEGFWASGDIGYLDEEGFLFINGRKKNLIITSYGRNISPEWIESILCSHNDIYQAAVFGEARPYLIAVLVCRSHSDFNVAETIKEINKNLPDYAKIKKYIISNITFTKQNGLLTDNGRIIPNKIYQYFELQINPLYEGEYYDIKSD